MFGLRWLTDDPAATYTLTPLIHRITDQAVYIRLAGRCCRLAVPHKHAAAVHEDLRIFEEHFIQGASASPGQRNFYLLLTLKFLILELGCSNIAALTPYIKTFKQLDVQTTCQLNYIDLVIFMHKSQIFHGWCFAVHERKLNIIGDDQ